MRPGTAAECDGLSTWIARYSFSSVPVGRPFRADFDGAFPGLKAWAVLLDRFAVRSNRLVYTAQAFRPGSEREEICPAGATEYVSVTAS
jgi:hypothetical protein